MSFAVFVVSVVATNVTQKRNSGPSEASLNFLSHSKSMGLGTIRPNFFSERLAKAVILRQEEFKKNVRNPVYLKLKIKFGEGKLKRR